MRTKTLLLTAALCAAGAATSMAQVYSVNMVGYINQSIPAGFSMIANHLNASPDNKVSTLLSAPPSGTSIYKFDPASGGYKIIQFFTGSGWEGDDVDMTLAPGEGVWIQPPSAFTATFVGEVPLNSTVPLAPGFQIISSALPQSLPLSGAPPAGLGFPVANNDETYQFNPATGGYRINQYFAASGWEGDDGGNPPTPAIGESFWVRTGTSRNWTRTFSVGP